MLQIFINVKVTSGQTLVPQNLSGPTPSKLSPDSLVKKTAVN